MSRLWDTEPELIPFASPDELETIKRGLFVHHEPTIILPLRKRLDSWRAQLPKPTREQMLQVTHEENRMHARLNGGNQQFWDGLEADWRRKQKPDFEPIRSDDSWPDAMRSWLEVERQEGRIYKERDEAEAVYIRTRPEPPPYRSGNPMDGVIPALRAGAQKQLEDQQQQHGEDAKPSSHPSNQRPPFANPPEWWTRRDRMERDTFIYGRPDPKDLAEEAAEKVRYQKALAEAFEQKRKEMESEAGSPQYPQRTIAHSATPVAEDTRSIVRPPDRQTDRRPFGSANGGEGAGSPPLFPETPQPKQKLPTDGDDKPKPWLKADPRATGAPRQLPDQPAPRRRSLNEELADLFPVIDQSEVPTTTESKVEIGKHAWREVLAYCWELTHFYFIAGGFLVGGGVALAVSWWLMAELLFAIGIVLFVAKGIHALWGKENRLAIAAIFSVAGLIAVGFEVTLIEWKRPYDAQPATSQPKASPIQIVDDRNTTLPLTPELQGTNAETRTIYNRVATDIRKALGDYQKTTGTSMYVVVPDMPTNLLSSEVLQYKGAVTFSQHAAWYIHLEKETSTYATLVVEFMNGDGTTVSGSGIGAVRFSYDPNSKTMNIAADGIGKAALGKADEKMSASGFRAKSSEIVNSLFQYQLDHL